MNKVVSAREVLDFWKLNADLVNLSAFPTGLGRQGGSEGLLGFALAFLLSGSRSVCLSLWEVDDIATAFMLRFYQNLLGQRDGLTAPLAQAKALEEAQKWLRNLNATEATVSTAKLTGGIARGTRAEKTFKLPQPSTPAEVATGDDYKPAEGWCDGEAIRGGPPPFAEPRPRSQSCFHAIFTHKFCG